MKDQKKAATKRLKRKTIESKTKSNWIMQVVKKRMLLNQQMEDSRIKASEISWELITGYRSFYNIKIKRMLDLILALVIFMGVFPIYVLVSIAIMLEDGFPILYCGERGGYQGKNFRIYKFRSMIKNADRLGGGTTALNDCRITKVGKIIRKMKVDEFPNLINVIRGEMSFIGPRPELPRYTEQYEGTEKSILKVRPGMTDYSSIEFINLDEIVGIRDADAMYELYVLPRKNKLRVKYAATVSFATDVKLFVMTVWKVFGKCYRILSKSIRSKKEHHKIEKGKYKWNT